MAARKYHDIVLPEVRKPAGYGNLITVIDKDQTRELWFQHGEEPSIIRCVEVDLTAGSAQKPRTIKTKAERNR